MRRDRRDRAAFALPLALFVACLVGIIGAAVHYTTTADRTTLEMVQGHRLLVLAASSAFEEASAVIESKNWGRTLPDDPSVGPNEPPRPIGDPGQYMEVPAEIAVDQTNKTFEAMGLKASAVRVEASEWSTFPGRADRATGGMLAQEIAMIGMAVDVTVRIGGLSSSRHTILCRRYAVAGADTVSGRLQVHVQPRNMVVQVESPGFVADP